MASVRMSSELNAPNAMKTSERTWLYLVPIPVLFFVIASIFVNGRGPFYCAYYYDPDYNYLVNALNLALGFRPEHVDHPGTTVQLFGAAIIKTLNFGSSDVETAVNVIGRAESYLNMLNTSLILIYSGLLFTTGWSVLKRTKSLLAAISIQSTPVFLDNNFSAWLRFNPEPFILICCLPITAILCVKTPGRENYSVKSLIPLSFLIATGCISKIIFFPVVLIPLFCLISWRERACYALGVLLFCFLWTSPLIAAYPTIANWIVSLITHKGRYGQGATGLLPDTYFRNLSKLLAANWLLTAMAALNVVALFFHIVRRRKTTETSERSLIQLVLGLALAESLQFLIAAKNPEDRYLIPAVAFCGLNSLLLIRFFQRCFQPSMTLVRAGVATGIVVLSVIGFRLNHQYQKVVAQRENGLELDSRWRTEKTNSASVFFYGAPSPIFAGWFANFWVGMRYSQILTKLQDDPSLFILNKWTGQTISPNGVVDLSVEAKHYRRILFMGETLDEERTFSLLHLPQKPRKILQRGPAALYELTVDKTS